MIKFRALLSALVFAGAAMSVPKVDAADFESVGRELARMLQNGHYARHPFNEKLSSRFLERYLTSLDPGRLYFLESEEVAFHARFGRDLSIGAT